MVHIKKKKNLYKVFFKCLEWSFQDHLLCESEREFNNLLATWLWGKLFKLLSLHLWNINKIASASQHCCQGINKKSHTHTHTHTHMQSPRWSSSKGSACQCRRHGFDPCVGKIPQRRKWQPTPIFLPGESHGRRAWQATVHGGHKSQTWLSD